MIRFVLVPGEIESQTDGQVHRITSKQLARLYGVNPAECVVDTGREQDRGRWLGLPRLYPRYDGQYEKRS